MALLVLSPAVRAVDIGPLNVSFGPFNTSFDRTWYWGIDKSADADLMLEADEIGFASYSVFVFRLFADDLGNFSGGITLDNLNEDPVMMEDISLSIVELSTPLLLDCAAPFDIPSFSSAPCSFFEFIFGDFSGLTSLTLRLSYQVDGASYDVDSDPIDWQPDAEYFASVDVMDSFDGGSPESLGTVNNEFDFFSYSRSFNAAELGPGYHCFDNTASINDQYNSTATATQCVRVEGGASVPEPTTLALLGLGLAGLAATRRRKT